MSKAWKKVKSWGGTALGFMLGGEWGFIYGALYDLYKSLKPDTPDMPGSEPSGRTLRSSKAPVRYILGRAATGGVLAFAQEQAGEQTDGELLRLVYVLSEGAVTGIDEIRLSEELITTFGAYASYQLVTNPTVADPYLLANCPDWRADMIGRGLSYLRVTLQYNAEKFQGGLPDIRVVVRGIPVYDPRTGAEAYSENTALHILWFLRERCGVPANEIVMDSFSAAANICDEQVQNPDGSFSPRYRTGCAIGADEKKTQVLEKLTQSCAGRLLRVGGKWMLQVGAYYGPADFTITESMVIGTVSGSTEVDNAQALNTVRGTFVDPSQGWADTDYPEVSVAAWLTEDGGEAAESLNFSYVTDVYQAQRLANIELRKRRTGGVLKLPMNFAGYNCRPGRVVTVNLPSINVAGEFVVTDWQMSPEEACSVTLEQYNADIWGDAVGVPYNPLPFIALPPGGLAAPTGLQWSARSDGESVQGLLSWTPPVGAVDYYNVVVRKGGEAILAVQVPGSAASCPLNTLAAGDYVISVSAQGPRARSGEASINVSIQGPPVPESCAVYAGVTEITLVPSNILRRLNGGTYEFWAAPNASTPAEQATYLGQGLSFAHAGLSFATQYHYYIRSRNAYGVSAWLYVAASTSSDPAAILQALTDQITESQLGQALAGRIDLIDGNGVGSVNARLDGVNSSLSAQISALQAELADIQGAADWASTQPWDADALVKHDGALYRAKQAVPIGVAITDTAYWQKIGDYASIGDAVASLAVDLSQLQTRVTATEGQISAQATQISGIQSVLPGKANASAVEALETRVEETESGLSAVTTATQRLTAQVVPQGAGDMNWGAGDQAVFAGAVTVQSVTADKDVAQGLRIDQLQAQVGDNSAAIQTEQQVRATADSALAQQINTVQAQVGDNSAAVQQVSEAVVDLDGTVSAMTTIKAQTTTGGRTVMAGLALGADGETSQILMLAQRVAIVDESTGQTIFPFVVQNGQVYINTLVLGSGVISSRLTSPDFISGVQGVMIDFSTGEFELNGSVPGQGSTHINTKGIKYIAANGVVIFQAGDLTA